MTALLDVNVLVALAWPNHVHHALVRRWFLENSGAGWATCALTETGFVRVSANATIVGEAVLPIVAIELLAKLMKLGRHDFWPSDLSLTSIPEALEMLIVGHRQVTDGYLLALAAHHEGRLVTLDRGVESLVPTGSGLADHLTLIRA